MSTQTIKSLDFKGLSCPMPIVNTAKALKQLDPAAVVEVLATDPGSVPDFKAWCKATGNELVESSEESGVYRFVIRKKG
jgi:tRNA 2-thiouridine synthesizing protein A